MRIFRTSEGNCQIFVELIWNLRAGYILVCYKSNSRNDVGEGEEAVAKRVDSNGMWYASNALLFSIGKLEIILIPIHHFLIFYLSCAGEQKISALFQFRILSCVQQGARGYRKN